MKSKTKFIIMSPPQRSGGSIALHALAKGMRDAGYDARLFLYGYRIFNYEGDVVKSINRLWLPIWIGYLIFIYLIENFCNVFGIQIKLRYTFKHIKGCRYCLRPRADDNTIVIYPESLHGNPLHAKNVGHWLLYYYYPPENGYGKDDLFIAYRKQFNNKKFNPKEYTATVSHFNLDLYKRYYYGEREGTCYIVRKGMLRNDVPEKFDGPIIDDLPEEEKVKCFNQYKYCVSYDMQTAYSGIAAMCGCISIIVPEKGKTISDYKTPEDNRDGVAFGFDEEEINRAIATSGNIYQRYSEVNENGKREAKKFAEICMQYFVIT